MRPRLTVSLICVLLTGSLAWSEERRPEPSLKLEPLIQEALEKQPEVLAARKRWEAARFRIPQATALPDPRFSIEQEATNNLERLALEVEYQVQQTFPFPGKLGLRGKAAGEEARRAEAEYRAKQADVASRVRVAYYELFLDHKSIEIKRQEIGIVQNFAKIAEGLYAVGKVSQQDVLKAQTVLAGLFGDLAPLDQKKASAEAALNTLLARSPDVPLGIPEPPAPPAFPYTRDQLRSLALEKRPEVEAARAAIARGEAALALAKRQLYPDISVGLEYIQVRNGRDKWETSVGISIPWLWSLPRYTAQALEAEAEISAALAEEQAVRGRTLFEIEDLLAKLRSAERQAVLYATSVLPLAVQTLDAAIPGYQTGRVDFLTLLENQRAVREVELAYHQAVVAFEQRRAEMERVVGTPLR